MLDETMSHNMSKQDAIMAALDGSFAKSSKDVGVQTEKETKLVSNRDLNMQAAQRKSCFFGCRKWLNEDKDTISWYSEFNCILSVSLVKLTSTM